MKEDSEKVPTLLTDYILKGKHMEYYWSELLDVQNYIKTLCCIFVSSPVSNLKHHEARANSGMENSFSKGISNLTPLVQAAWPPLFYHYQPWILTINIIVFTSTMTTAFRWAHFLPSLHIKLRLQNDVPPNNKWNGWFPLLTDFTNGAWHAINDHSTTLVQWYRVITAFFSFIILLCIWFVFSRLSLFPGFSLLFTIWWFCSFMRTTLSDRWHTASTHILYGFQWKNHSFEYKSHAPLSANSALYLHVNNRKQHYYRCSAVHYKAFFFTFSFTNYPVLFWLFLISFYVYLNIWYGLFILYFYLLCHQSDRHLSIPPCSATWRRITEFPWISSLDERSSFQ